MPNFAGSKTQRVAGRYICRASRPANTRARLAAWTASQNYVLLFSRHLQARRSRQTSATPFRLNSLQSTTLSGRLLLHSRRQPATAFCHISFHTSPHNLTLARNLHSGLTGQYISALTFFLFLSFSSPLHSTQKRKPAKPISISFSYNHKFSPNLVQAFPSRFP